MKTTLDRLSLALALGVALTALPAAAQVSGGLFSDCTTAADCGGGLDCVGFVEDWCEGSGGDPDDGAGGGSPREPLPPECEEETIFVCYPRTCTASADCATGLSCVTFTERECDGSVTVVCDENGDCVEVEEEGECTTTSESFCVPPWAAPCTVDADCGPGFACVARDDCGYGSEEGGYDDEDCEPSTERSCRFLETPCGDGQSCGTGLVCEDFSVCADEDDEETGGSGEEPAPIGEDEAGLCVEETLCVPPGFEYWMGVSAAAGSDGEDGESLGGRGNAKGGSGDDDGGSSCASAGGGLSLLGLLGVALLLRRR